MSILNSEQAATNAEKRTRNIPNACQIVTRGYYGAPSVGDVDGDGSSDAEDGWKSEPASGKHLGDRTPPRGMPVSWLHGSSDHGHRAISLGNGMIRSTDVPVAGQTSTVPLRWIEDNWHLEYAGWSETISGIKIPLPAPPKPPQTRVNKARKLLQKARDLAKKNKQPKRVAQIQKALDVLPKK